MTRKTGLGIWSIAFCVAMVALYKMLSGPFELNTDFLNFLDTDKKKSSAEIAEQIYLDRQMSQVIVAFRSSHWESLSRAVRTWGPQICQWKYSKDCRWQANDDNVMEMGRMYDSHKAVIVDTKSFKNASDQEIVESRLRQLYAPTGVSALSRIQSDPFGVVETFFKQLKVTSAIEIRDGLMVTEKQGASYAFVFFKWQSKGTDGALLLEKQLNQLQSQMAIEDSGTSVVVASGQLHLADGAKRSLLEANVLGGVSMVLVALLVYVAFSSFWPLVGTLLVLFFSLSCGLVLCWSVLGSLHIAALLMGVSLTGVMADYCIHFFAHSLGQKQQTLFSKTFSQIRQPLVLSFITSCAGYVGFLLSGVIVLEQLALIALGALTASIFSIYFLFPSLEHRVNTKNGGLILFLQQAFENKFLLNAVNVFAKIKNVLPKGVLLFLTLVIGVGSVWILRGSFNDDVRLLQKRNPKLVEQEQQLKSLLGIESTGKYYLVKGATLNDLLENEYQWVHQFETDPGIWSGLYRWIPPMSVQQESARVFDRLNKIAPQLFKQLGFNESNLSHLEGRTTDDFLTWSEVEPSIKNFPVWDQYLGQVGEFYYSALVPANDKGLYHVASENVISVDRANDISVVFTELRQHLLFLLAVVTGVVVAMSTFVWGARGAFQVCCGPVAGVLFAGLCSYFVFSYLNIFHVLGFILIYFLGIDYAFFSYTSRVRTQVDSRSMGASYGVFVSVLTTLASFGILGLSGTAAVQSFGVCVSIGILVVFAVVRLQEGVIQC